MTFNDDYPEIGDSLPEQYQTIVYAACVSRTRVLEILKLYVAEANHQAVIEALKL